MHIISPSLVQSAEDKKAVTEVVGHITGTITDAIYPSDDNQSSGGQFSHITVLCCYKGMMGNHEAPRQILEVLQDS